MLVAGERRIQVTALQVRDRRGDAVGQYLLLRDRTEEHRLERVARQTQRMQTVGTLAAGIAHEVNNPLAFIRANLTEIQRLGEIAESHREGPDAKLADELADLSGIAAETLDGIHRIERIVSGMRRLSTPRGEPVARVDLNEVARDAVRLANLHRDPRVAVELALWQKPVWVEGSARRLGQAVLNVVLNAHQALEHSARWADRDLDPRRGRSGGDRGHGQRARDPARAPGSDLRSVLHHQEPRQGDRPRPRDRLRHRARARGTSRSALAARARARPSRFASGLAGTARA